MTEIFLTRLSKLLRVQKIVLGLKEKTWTCLLRISNFRRNKCVHTEKMIFPSKYITTENVLSFPIIESGNSFFAKNWNFFIWDVTEFQISVFWCIFTIPLRRFCCKNGDFYWVCASRNKWSLEISLMTASFNFGKFYLVISAFFCLWQNIIGDFSQNFNFCKCQRKQHLLLAGSNYSNERN